MKTPRETVMSRLHRGRKRLRVKRRRRYSGAMDFKAQPVVTVSSRSSGEPTATTG
jgi:hypothetical protein